MTKIRKNKKLLLLVVISLLNLSMIQKENCDENDINRCCHAEVNQQIVQEESCCESESSYIDTYQHQNSFDYCGCIHEYASNQEYLQNSYNSINQIDFMKFDYLSAPQKIISIEFNDILVNLNDIPIYLSKQSFII